MVAGDPHRFAGVIEKVRRNRRKRKGRNYLPTGEGEKGWRHPRNSVRSESESSSVFHVLAGGEGMESVRDECECDGV